MRRPALLACCALVAFAGTPIAGHATAIFGTLGNFDVVNDTGRVAHGFEIDLEGLHLSDITDTFGGAGRGFPTTVERYGAPTVSEYSTGSSFGVSVVYRADLSGPQSGWVGTPTGVYTTPGESCWTGGGAGYGPSTPCDHFGVGMIGNPTRTTYAWLVEDTPGSSVLVPVGSSVVAPVWTVTPPAPGAPPAPPVVVAQIRAPEAEAADLWGPAIWVKVFTTELEGAVDLHELVGDNPKVKEAEQHTEIEWQLLQRDPGNPFSGILENGGGGAVGDKAEAVLRRYEFYKYTGAFSAEGEALPANGDSNPADGELGAFMGDQNAAVNFAQIVASVPEPTTWALMIIGTGLVGAQLRRRRRAEA